MSERTDREFLSDILEAIRRIKVYTAGMTYQAFLEDTKTQDAVLRNLEIIGEATKNLSRSCGRGIPRFRGRLWQEFVIGWSMIISA